MACREYCLKIKEKNLWSYDTNPKNPFMIRTNPYHDNKKYCRICEVYLRFEGLFCPCCGVKLRVSPHNNKSREKLKNFRQEQKLKLEQANLIDVIVKHV